MKEEKIDIPSAVPSPPSPAAQIPLPSIQGERLTVNVPVPVEESKQDEAARRWCFKSFALHYFKMRVQVTVALSMNKLWLTLSYLALFLVAAARIALHIYVLLQFSNEFTSLGKVVFILEIGISLLWLAQFLRVYLSKLKLTYVENNANSSSVYILFCVSYYLLSFLATEMVFDVSPNNYWIAALVLFFVYGFIADKSPNTNALVCYLIFFLLLIELLVRICICRLQSPFETGPTHTFKKTELPLFAFAASTYDQKTCNICLADFVEGEKVCPLPCHHTHVFHPDCLKQWLAKSCCCPDCRTPVATN